MSQATILVVEDEPLIAIDIERRLMRLGYTVCAAVDSAETALAAVAQFQPDLVLMDIQLRGDVDGIQTAAQIWQQFQLPVIYLTAHADSTTLTEAKSTKPFGYIVKPFENHDLSTAIEIALSRHQAEMAVQQALTRERELHDLKTRFVSIVSHEFRNPLSSIQFALELLKGHEALSPEKRRTYIHRAEVCVKRMKNLMEDVLIVGESEAGKLQCQSTRFDVYQFCQLLVDDFQLNADGQYEIAFQLTYQGGKTDNYYCLDERLLHHILANLLSNAIKYSPDGSRVLLHLVCEPTHVMFCVQDHGIGIPDVDRGSLFSPFHRGENAKNIPGTGLGLSIVKQAVDAHGGTITIDSKVGVGTTITVTLPSSLLIAN